LPKQQQQQQHFLNAVLLTTDTLGESEKARRLKSFEISTMLAFEVFDFDAVHGNCKV
jgi:hypothetical protein